MGFTIVWVLADDQTRAKAPAAKRKS